MKMQKILIIIFILFSVAATSNAQNKKFGLGVLVGEPTGISAKLWLNNKNALAFGLGWSITDNKFGGSDPDYGRITRTHIHADYLWHSFNALSPNGNFSLFYGIGARINTGPEYSGTFAVRGIIGIAWLPPSTPLDLFIEVVPTLRLIHSTGFGIDAAIGIRFFF